MYQMAVQYAKYIKALNMISAGFETKGCKQGNQQIGMLQQFHTAFQDLATQIVWRYL